MGKFNQAKVYAEKCLNLSLQQNDLIMLACAYRILGDIFCHSNKDEAILFYTKAKKTFTKANDVIGADEVSNLITKI